MEEYAEFIYLNFDTLYTVQFFLSFSFYAEYECIYYSKSKHNAVTYSLTEWHGDENKKFDVQFLMIQMDSDIRIQW